MIKIQGKRTVDLFKCASELCVETLLFAMKLLSEVWLFVALMEAQSEL